MLVQLQAEHRETGKRTLFAQGEFHEPQAMHEWVRELTDRRQDELDEGESWMLCDETSDKFFLAHEPAGST